MHQQELRLIEAPFVVSGPSGVAVRTRLKDLTAEDEKVLAMVGAHLGSLASQDLKARCADGLEHSADTWAARKRELTPVSSSRWAGTVTKASHDQWALARRGQLAHIQSLEAGIKTVAQRLSLPVGEKGSKKTPGGSGTPRPAAWRHLSTGWRRSGPTARPGSYTSCAVASGCGRRAQGHPIRRRTTPPHDDQSDRRGHRTVQAGPEAAGHEESRPRIPGPRTRCAGTGCGENAGDQGAQHRSGHAAEHEFWRQDSLRSALRNG